MTWRNIGVSGGALAVALILAAQAAAAQTPAATVEALAREVADTERAFAKTLADRDHAAFRTFLADEAVFFAGDTPVRGKDAVAESWRALFEEETPPFSWAPETVEVLDSGSLALSSGPVHGRDGKLIGHFTSIWRREAPGTWRIVFDKGCPACEPCES